MMATGPWQDTVYSACCFMGARCKAQRLRHNIDEIAQWPALRCRHTHAADEWQPYLQDGQRVFPSKEEAEYTASLAFGIAVSASWWAARMGLAKLHVPRFPFVETAGRREHWLQINPRALREWAMAPTAIALGLRPTHPEERARTPHRTRVVDVILEDKTLPPGVIYVGRGHHSHRLPVTKWSSPFVPGHNCDPSSWLPLYVEHIMQHLAGDLPELTGCILACDCEMHMVCEGDALAGWCIRAGTPGAGRGGRSPPYGGRSYPVLVARGGRGCVSLALPSALFRELLLSYGGGLGEPTTVYVLHTMAAQSWAPLGWAAGPDAGFPSTKAAGPDCGRSAGRGAVWEGSLPPIAPIWAVLRAALRVQPGSSR